MLRYPLPKQNIHGPAKLSIFIQVMSKDQQVIGKISKHWSGILKEAFTDADNFGIQFPMDLDVKIKAVLLGAVFLIVGYCLFFCYLLNFVMVSRQVQYQSFM